MMSNILAISLSRLMTGSAHARFALIGMLLPAALLGAAIYNRGESSADLRAGVCDDLKADQLFYGVLQSDIAIMRQAIARGANVNACARSGTTPLVSAISGPRATSSQAIAMLIRSGADANYSTERGVSPLMCAVLSANDEALRTLLATGANADQRDRCGQTAIDYARETENKTAQDILQRHAVSSAR